MSTPSAPKILAHCPLCQTAYEDRAIRLLGAQGASRMFHLTCASCRHAVLAVILENQHGISSVGLVTDMEAQDALRMHDVAPITANDCVAAHEVLESKSQDVVLALLQSNA